MGENINFIPATDLPVAEGEEVSVLCLENGAMKQKPASGLGGGSVIMIRYSQADYEDGDSVFEVEPVPVGTFARVKAMFTGGEAALVLMVAHSTFTTGIGEVVEDYQDAYAGGSSYIPANGPYPEAVVFVDNYNDNAFGMLADDVIMTMEEFQQVMAGFGGGV